MMSPEAHLVKESRVPVQNLRVPVQKTTSPFLKILGPLCIKTRQLICKKDSKTLYNSRLKLKYSPSILKHNKGLMKYASLPTAIIGSLRCHDGDGNENVQNSDGLIRQSNNSALASLYLAHFFAVTARLLGKHT